jgi:hypothetical protein
MRRPSLAFLIPSLFSSLIASLPLLIAAATTAGCSSSSEGPPPPSGTSEISGVVGGVQFSPLGAVDIGVTSSSSTATGTPSTSASSTGSNAASTSSGAVILISEKPNTCSNAHLASTTALELIMFGDIAPGTYDVVSFAEATGASGTVVAALTNYDGACTSTNASPATAGTVTITSASSTELAGSAKLTFADGQISGAFSAPICQAGSAFSPAPGAGDTVCAP